MNEDKNDDMNPLHMIVINEVRSRGMKRIYELENYDFNKDLTQFLNTRHLIFPSNSNPLISNLPLVTIDPSSRIRRDVKKKKGKKGNINDYFSSKHNKMLVNL
jgi:hypothetical protein